MPMLEILNVSRSYGSTRALDDFSLEIGHGEALAILGPSGSGKSTLLRIVAGLENPDAGRVLLDGKDLAQVPAHKRGFGLMFQDYCLFPHLRVEQNIQFGLRMQKMESAERRTRTREMLRLARLESFVGRDVLTLSGGEQQRVALARSLAPAPRLLMLDEPLGALDVSLRASLLAELADILRQVGVTVLYVTHDHAEAMTIASRIALVASGKLIQAGRADELIQSPANAFVASFLGLGALVPGQMSAEQSGPRFLTPIGSFPLASREISGTQPSGSKGRVLLVRPSAISMAQIAGHLPVKARLISRLVRPLGATLRIGMLGAAGEEYPMDTPLASAGDAPVVRVPGTIYTVWIDPFFCEVLPDPEGRATSVPRADSASETALAEGFPELHSATKGHTRPAGSGPGPRDS
jgi:ABC-type Fe3+/spermidine/putrescine transport system ATPase subunit